MNILVDLFYGVMFFGIGFGIIKYRRLVKSWTGNFVWAEQYIGRGGTYFILMILGIFLMFLGILQPFGGLELISGGSNDSIYQNNRK